MIGKDEKSIGVAVWIATMTIKSAKMMLKVKKISSIKGGIGRTRSVRTNSTMSGVISELSGKELAKCRKFVSEKSIDSITY
tara:strand:+ start:134 stop:376 length:243 start_codon:yes stop_codon:yes gene_type:complete